MVIIRPDCRPITLKGIPVFLNVDRFDRFPQDYKIINNFFVIGEFGRCAVSSPSMCVLSVTLIMGMDSVKVKKGWRIFYKDEVCGFCRDLIRDLDRRSIIYAVK